MSSLIRYLQQNPLALQIYLSLMGLLIGSFLNVVIYRYPIMLKRQWALMSREYLEENGASVTQTKTASKNETLLEEHKVFNLSVPASTCPQCNHKIRWYENIPVLSYVFLKGRCSQCLNPISLRYPFVEILTALTFLSVTTMSQPDLHLVSLLGFSIFLIVLSGIDIDHQILPDPMVFILLWGGLVASLLGLTIPLQDAVMGALAGYLSLWSIYWLFKLLTKKEGMGYGDFKLFAALGAWLGWQDLLPVLLIASLAGAIIGGIAMAFFKSSNKIPFGPYLAVAGWIMMFWGESLINAYLKWSGLA